MGPVWLLIGAIALGLLMTALACPPLGVLAVALIAATAAWAQPREAAAQSPTARLLLLTAMAITVLGVFRLVLYAVPWLWLAVDAFSAGLGHTAGWIAGRPLSVGPTYGGVDYLVTMAVILGGWIAWSTSPPDTANSRSWQAADGKVDGAAEATEPQDHADASMMHRAASKHGTIAVASCFFAAILVGHLIYLVILARTDAWLAMLPELAVPEASENAQLGVWTWGNAARSMLPWNLPLLAAAIHATLVAVMLRCRAWTPLLSADDLQPKSRQTTGSSRGSDPPELQGMALAMDSATRFGPAVLGVLLPLIVIAASLTSDLTGRRVVAYNEGYLNWMRPTWENIDEQPVASYGLLPWLVESLGGEFARSDTLSDADLANADTLVAIHPDQPWPADRLQRVWKWVRDGGTLLVAGEPRLISGESRSSFNELLRARSAEAEDDSPTADGASIRVHYDTAITATRNWDENYAALSHPVTAGIGESIAGGGGPGRNWFGYRVPSSLWVGWPARPMLTGRFAFADPGSDAARTDIWQYDPGERLGDLVLAAEQPVGRGRVIVLGGTAPLSNEMLMESYVFTGRVLGYLAGGGASPTSAWRQILGVLVAVGLVLVLLWRPQASRLVLGVLVLAGATWVITAATHYAAAVRPDGAKLAAAQGDALGIAYVDTTHGGTFAGDRTMDDGLGTFAATMARNGYLPLMMPDFSEQRLNGASMLFEVAPYRGFSEREIAVIERWVDAGGRLFVTAGAEQAGPVNPLLEQFQLHVPPSPVPPWSDVVEPLPMGSFNLPYYTQGDFEAMVYFWDAWQVESSDPDASHPAFKAEWGAPAYGETTPLNRDVPVAVQVKSSDGLVTLFGDSAFLLNKTFRRNPQPHGNAFYWRWLLTRLDPRPIWNPSPAIVPESEPDVAQPDSGQSDLDELSIPDGLIEPD